MTESSNSPATALNHRLQPVVALLQKQRLVASVSHRQQQQPSSVLDSLLMRQQSAELKRQLGKLNSPDIAHLLTTLPIEEREQIWPLLSDETAADVLLEAQEAILEFLIEHSGHEQLLRILACLSTEELSEIADVIPEDVLATAKATLASQDRSWLEDTLSYPDDTVGYLMGKESLNISETATVEDATELIRSIDSLPAQSDKIFVINHLRHVSGVIPLTALLRNPPSALIRDIMETDIVRFRTEERTEDASAAFERYDLVSAPVIDHRNRLVGRLTVESVMDFLRDAAAKQALAKEGLSVDADLLGPIFDSAKERWPWLCLNLITAFIATRFISIFSGTIEQLVALAALMPIVASVGGNSGNQTAALVIRAIARDEITINNRRFIIRKEILVSAINGLIWGAAMGAFAAALYGNLSLGLVMLTAVTLNLILAASIGIGVPLVLDHFNKDPAMGSSVVLTFVTDSMGFFLFLGLATIILL